MGFIEVDTPTPHYNTIHIKIIVSKSDESSQGNAQNENFWRIY